MLKRVNADSLRRVSASRICLIKPSAFGDVIQTLPILPVLRRRFPRASITWVVNRSLRDLVAGHPNVDHLIEFERRGSWKSWATTLRQLRNGQFDLVLDLQGLLRTGVMCRATRAALRVGLETAREGSRFACHYIIPGTGKDEPAWSRYAKVATALGADPVPRQIELQTSALDTEFVHQQLQYLTPPVIAIHAGARWETKRWPLEHFAEVARRAVAGYRASIVLVGSPDERELGNQLHREISGRIIGAAIRNLVGRTSLKQLAAVLSASDVVLSNDSGPMHLAAGLQTPVLGLFTCTDPQRSGPRPDVHRLVSSHVECAGSYCRVCPHSGADFQKCHRELTPDRVWSELQTLIDQVLIDSSAA